MELGPARSTTCSSSSAPSGAGSTLWEHRRPGRLRLLLGRTWVRVIGITWRRWARWRTSCSFSTTSFWSMTIIALDVFVIWALAVHGRELRDARSDRGREVAGKRHQDAVPAAATRPTGAARAWRWSGSATSVCASWRRRSGRRRPRAWSRPSRTRAGYVRDGDPAPATKTHDSSGAADGYSAGRRPRCPYEWRCGVR
jgi:hypothetical protein